MGFNIDNSVDFLVAKLAVAIKNNLNKNIKRYGISAEQWSVLFRVVKEEGITQKRLSELTFKDQGNLTRMIDKLVERGYLLKHNDENDRRSVKLFATHSSKQLVQKISPICEDQNRELLKGFTQDEEEVFIELLNKAYSNIF